MKSFLTLAYTEMHRASHLTRRIIGGSLIALFSIAFVLHGVPARPHRILS